MQGEGRKGGRGGKVVDRQVSDPSLPSPRVQHHLSPLLSIARWSLAALLPFVAT